MHRPSGGDEATDLREALGSAGGSGAGFGLLQLSPAEAELESAFLQITRQGQQQPAAAGGKGESSGSDNGSSSTEEVAG